jgi:glycosyltransferase involved in cell wall biosynthesis
LTVIFKEVAAEGEGCNLSGEKLPMRQIAIYRADLLPISETFVRDQINGLRSWRPILLGAHEIKDGLLTPGVQREVVPAGTVFSKAWHLLLNIPYKNLVGKLKALDVELVHVHFGMDATRIWPSVKAAGLPMLVTLHGYDINVYADVWKKGLRGQINRVYPQRLLKLAAEPNVNFLAVSEAIKNRAIVYGIPSEKILVSYIGVDVDRFSPAGLPLQLRKRRILFTGRMVEKKAPLLMVRAFAKVREIFTDAELVMIGAGPLLGAAKELAKQLGVPVEFMGAQPSNVVMKQLQEARVFCLPSVTARDGDAEGFGIVLLEAQACGVPVVTSARGGADEGILNGTTGHAFSEGDISGCVTGLLFFLSNELPDNAAEKIRDFTVENFHIKKHASMLESIYDKCVLKVND